MSALSVINPTDILKMPDKEIDAMLDIIRLERLKAYSFFKETEAKKKELRDLADQEKLDRQLNMLAKDIAQMNTKLNKIDDRVKRIKELRLHLGVL